MDKIYKTIIACDSFKGCLSSSEVGEACRKGIAMADPDCKVMVFPIADGGEGTVEALRVPLGLKIRKCVVEDPLGNDIEAEYGVGENGKLAVMEIASVAGIGLVDDNLRNPAIVSTAGVGQMLLDILEAGGAEGKGSPDEIWVGLGGSASCDGGTSMLEALGVKFYDKEGDGITNLIGYKLSEIAAFDASGMDPRLKDVKIKCICDVDNPFCGEDGAARVFAPQKGASAETVDLLERGMENFRNIILKGDSCRNIDRKRMDNSQNNRIDNSRKESVNYEDCVNPAGILVSGAGAAGGLGGAFAAFLNAELIPGIDLILDKTGFDKEAEDASLVITGEGRLDSQTKRGKVAAGVLRRIRKNYATQQVPVIAIAGEIENIRSLNDMGFTSVFCIQSGPATLGEAMNPARASFNIQSLIEQFFRFAKLPSND